MLDEYVKEGFTNLLKETFRESLAQEPEYWFRNQPKETSVRDYTIFAQVKLNRWLLQRFRVGGIDTELFGFYEGFIEGRNQDKAVYLRTHLGTIYDFAIPRGFALVKKGGKSPQLTSLRLSGESELADPTDPLLMLVKSDLQNNKSKLVSLMDGLPRKIKYKVSGVMGSEYEAESEVIMTLVPRQGKTIATVQFLSFQPKQKKSKGRTTKTAAGTFEVGTTFGPNMNLAYKLLRHFQDIPDVCKVASARTSELATPVGPWAGTDNRHGRVHDTGRESKGTDKLSEIRVWRYQTPRDQLGLAISYFEYGEIASLKWGMHAYHH
ncbi:MAG: hypothetical protein ACXABZ_13710 [Candidatus Thorarchaeota archaeon]|jgi:hypothetical protein